MAQQQTRSGAKVLERGNIYFFYRPDVEKESPEGLSEVQRTYIVLSPHGKDRYRLIIVGKKQLPEARAHERYWGFVDLVSSSRDAIRDELGPETYETKTRGERKRPAARPAGEGVYALVRHDDHTHLAYVLELPEEPGEVQKALGIKKEGSYIIGVKNPEASPERGLPQHRRADFPKHLRERFRGRRWIALDPPDFLDYEGAELVLIGAAEDIEEELGIRLEAQHETERTAEIFRDLRIHKSEHPVAPLFEGVWE